MKKVDSEAQAHSEEITLKELVFKFRSAKKYLISRWKTILIWTIIGGVLGLTYSLLTKPIYKAELSFALQDDNSSSGGIGAAMGLASQFGIDLSGGGNNTAFTGDNLLELMKSRRLVENTLLSSVNINGKLQTLANIYINFNNLREKWNKVPKLKNIEFLPNTDRDKFTLEQDSILGIFYHIIIKKNLTVDKVDKKLTIVNVKFESKNEIFSKLFTEILVKNVSEFYIETKTKRSSQNVNILQKQTDSVRRELNSAITGVAASSDINPNPNPSLQIIRVPSQRRQVDVQANIAILTELVKNLEISKMSLRKETPLIQVIDYPTLPLEKEKLGKLIGTLGGAILMSLGSIIILLFSWLFKELMND